MPVPDFPRTFPEFVRRFPDDTACWTYLKDVRWPDGMTCAEGHRGWFLEKRSQGQYGDTILYGKNGKGRVRSCFVSVTMQRPPRPEDSSVITSPARHSPVASASAGV